MRRIVLIQGHPDPAGAHFCDALADAYADGARQGGHEIRPIDVATIEFPWLHNQDEFAHGPTPPAIAQAQEAIRWADHVVIVYPLWLGMLPARLKAFLEQVLRPEFAFSSSPGGLPKGRLKGRSARIVVTMGMPAFAYRWIFGAHSLKALRRSVLRFCGFGPIRATLIGNVETKNARVRERWLERMRSLGCAGI